MRVLAISGSLRRGSHNTRLLAAAAEHAPAGVELELFDGLGSIPPYDEDIETDGTPAAVAAFHEAIDAADALLIATPEYNGSIPGQLKNALDWASRPFATNVLRNKPVAVVGASTGMFGAIWAQAELRRVLGLIGARVLDREVPVGQAAQRFDASGRLVDAEIRSALRSISLELVEAAEQRLAAAA